MDAKSINKAKILEYLSEPSNDFLKRADIAVTVLGYKQPRTLYRHFTPDELTEIELLAFEERRRRSVRPRAKVYAALYEEAVSGNVQAAKEYLDRIEGKTKEKADSTSASEPQPIKVEIIREDASKG